MFDKIGVFDNSRTYTKGDMLEIPVSPLRNAIRNFLIAEGYSLSD